MTKEYIEKYIERKIEENPDKIQIMQDELKMSIADISFFCSEVKRILIEKGYNIYNYEEEYTYKDEIRIVDGNEIFVAIK